MLRPGKGLNTYLALRTKRSNKKQKARFSITDITKQELRKLLKKFNDSPYLGNKSKKVNIEPTEAYLFITKQITKLMKSKRQVQLRNNFVILGVNKTIGHVNE